ncbi:hypothetical protein Q0A17_20795 [Citrobacter sp. S2-9]|uniref:Uncharacterized protein n=1 Tax=Citrobacter enshiensis TaxID=2971264 RepID=A0ABT8PZG9_9ENTR|nr:hypothetical protein [Citrobacter enshiensis]MDN8601826.1 hypothetical protein [Citrobacter enshiensis]
MALGGDGHLAPVSQSNSPSFSSTQTLGRHHCDVARLAGYRYPKRQMIGDTAMSDYSCLSILKSKAKKLVRINGIKQTEALEIVAKEAQFASYHELSQVAKGYPFEPRLVLAAMGESSLKDVIYTEEVFSAIETEVGELLSGETADTNAYNFTVEDLYTTKANYDEQRGVLAVNATFKYQGEQDPDRPYSGKSFDVVAEMELILRENKWSLVDDSLELTSVVSDTDSDWYDYVDMSEL